MLTATRPTRARNNLSAHTLNLSAVRTTPDRPRTVSTAQHGAPAGHRMCRSATVPSAIHVAVSKRSHPERLVSSRKLLRQHFSHT